MLVYLAQRQLLTSSSIGMWVSHFTPQWYLLSLSLCPQLYRLVSSSSWIYHHWRNRELERLLSQNPIETQAMRQHAWYLALGAKAYVNWLELQVYVCWLRAEMRWRVFAVRFPYSSTILWLSRLPIVHLLSTKLKVEIRLSSHLQRKR